ncbi:YfhO family protein [Patescibacteria group bacterium]|nr:YfhO family protein [Patescibacteria group bacterium]
MRLKKSLVITLPFLSILFIVFLFYHQFFLKKLLPIPADIITGMYYPWLNLKFPSYPTGVPVKNYLPSDVVSLTYPLRYTAIDLLKKGTLPFINLHILSGVPLLSNFQSAVTNPLNILYFLNSDFSLVWSWQIILQLLLGLTGAYLFLKSCHLATLPSLIGSVIFAGGGFFSLWGQYNTVIHAVIPLPFILLAINKFSTNRLYGLLITFSLFYSINSGNPPITMIVIFITLLYLFSLYRLQFRSYLPFLMFILFSFLLSAPLLLPGFQTSQASIRSEDNVVLTNNIKQASLFRLVTLIIPDYFGNPATLNQWPNSGLYDNLTIFQGSVSLILLFLFFKYIFDSHKQLHFFVLLSLISSLLLIFANPLTYWLTFLKALGFSSMVFTRFHFVLNFSVSIASAIFLDRFLKTKSIIFNHRLFKLLLIFVPSTLLALFLFSLNKVFKFSPFLVAPNTSLLVSLKNTIFPLIISFFSIFFLILASQFYSVKRLSLIFLLLLIIFENYRFFSKYNSFSPAAFLYPNTPETTFLQINSQRFLRDSGPIMPSNMWEMYGINSASGYDTLQSKNYNQFLSFVNGRSLNDVSSRFPEIENITSPLVNFLGIDYILTLKWDAIKRISANGSVKDIFLKGPFKLVSSNGPLAIYHNPGAYPLFFSVDHLQTTTNISNIESALKSHDLRNFATVDKPVNQSNFDAQISFGPLNKLLQGYRFSYHASETGFLVTSHAFDPNWHALIDNQVSPIVKTDFAFMGFFVPPGNHTVNFFYEPNPFYLGLRISLISFILLLIFSVYFFISSRHAHRT